METKKIYSALASIMREVRAIEKKDRNEQQRFMYRGIDAIMNDLHDIFAKNGVVILPEVVDYGIRTETNIKGTKLFYTHTKVVFHFVAEDGSEVTTTMVGEAMDSGDKSMNKSMSIALKYALLEMFLIPTREDKDPDAQSHEVSGVPTTQGVVGVDAAIAEVNAAKSESELFALWSKYSQINPGLTAEGSPFYTAWAKRRGEVSK